MNFVSVPEERFRLTISPYARKSEFEGYPGVIAYKNSDVLLGFEVVSSNTFYMATSIFRN